MNLRKVGNIRKQKVSFASNIIVSIILVFVSLFIYFLQACVFSNITIAGVMPNLFVIFILVIGLFGNNTLSLIFSIICGIWIDSIYVEVIGITSAMLCLIGFMATWFDSLWSKDEKISIVIMVIIATFIFEFGCYFLRSIIFDFEMELWPFFKILAIEELYNILLTIIFFGVIKKVGYSMERKLKRNNMYTVEL